MHRYPIKRFWRAAVLPAVLIAATLMSPVYSGKAVAADALTGNRLTGRVINSNGKPIAGAQVQLLDLKKTMMDLTVTGADGRFNLDLGVLEEAEMEKLRQFTLQITVKGRKYSHGLDAATSSGGTVQIGTIELH